jgi:hypothetical protein
MPIKQKKRTPAQTRILIAKDVIKQLKAELTVTPSPSEYCDIPPLKFANEGDDLQKIIADQLCFGCAKGALFLAHVRRFDGVKVRRTYTGDFSPDARGGDALRDYFSKNELDSIEDAYECSSPRSRSDAELAFYLKYPGASVKRRTARLIAICKNIIKHGNFKPEKESQ